MAGELCRSDRACWRGALARVPVPCGLPPSVNPRCFARLASTNGWLTASASIGRRGTRLGEGWAPPLPISIAPPCPPGTPPASPCALPPSLLALSFPADPRLQSMRQSRLVVSFPKLCNASEIEMVAASWIVASRCVAKHFARPWWPRPRSRPDQRCASRCQERCATAATPLFHPLLNALFIHPSTLTPFLKL
jgi:hypothetical protein